MSIEGTQGSHPFVCIIILLALVVVGVILSYSKVCFLVVSVQFSCRTIRILHQDVPSMFSVCLYLFQLEYIVSLTDIMLSFEIYLIPL